MSLWDWTLRVYGQPGVPEACLMLQEDHGQNTCLLLWAVWAEAADAALLVNAADVARRWEALALTPLRGLRRALKPAFAGIGHGAREALRDDVKAAELRAERVLMESLEALAGQGGSAYPLAALQGASAAWAGRTRNAAPNDALAVLAAALL